MSIFEFEWNELKAATNVRKHNVSFELAATVFHDPRLLTLADCEHGNGEERWFSIGWASNGTMLFVCYLWSESESGTTKIRLISARRATPAEVRCYEEMA